MPTKVTSALYGIEKIELVAELLYADGSAVLCLRFDKMEQNWHFQANAQGRLSWLASRRFKRKKGSGVLVFVAADGERKEYLSGDSGIDTAALAWYRSFTGGTPDASGEGEGEGEGEGGTTPSSDARRSAEAGSDRR